MINVQENSGVDGMTVSRKMMGVGVRGAGCSAQAVAISATEKKTRLNSIFFIGYYLDSNVS